MWFIRQFWKSLGILTLLGGIFWAPKDAADWRDAAEPWRRLIAMVDQTTALWMFAVLAGGYILWIDARPLLIPVLRKQFPFWFHSGDRISLLALGDLAKQKGWNLGTDSFESLDLINGIKQAAADGRLIIDARMDCSVQELADHHPLQPVPRDIFADHWIDVPRLFEGGADNFNTSLYRPGRSPRIRANDLHLSNADAAKKWLAREAPKWRGRAAEGEAKRRARQGAPQLSSGGQDAGSRTPS